MTTIAMYGYKCQYCEGTVQPKRVAMEGFKHKSGLIILENVVVIGVSERTD